MEYPRAQSVDERIKRLEEANPKLRSKQEHPAETAERFLLGHEVIANPACTYLYNGTFWYEVSDAEMCSKLMPFDEESGGIPHSRRRREMLAHIRDKRLIARILWNRIAAYEIPFINGVLDLTADEMRPHRAKDYLENIIPHRYDPMASSDLWMKCLHQYFAHDEDGAEKIDALQEFFGYTLLPHAKFKKALVPYSHIGDTGKSTVKEMAEHLVGESAVCHIGVDRMGDRFALSPIVGKRLNSVSEQSVNVRLADGPFKELVDVGSVVQVERKGKEPFNYPPIAKHLICTNNLPRIDDTTNAVYNRLLIIEFTRPIAKKDTNLWDKLKHPDEFAGIVRWAVDGAKRLHENGGEFTSVPSSEKIVKAHKRNQNPISEFLEGSCVKMPAGEKVGIDWRINRREMLDHYRDYYGNKNLSLREFSNALTGYGIKSSDRRARSRGRDGVILPTETCIEGYRWKTQSERSVEQDYDSGEK